MSSHPTAFKGSVVEAIREAVVRHLPDAVVQVEGGGGHYRVAVQSQQFAGKSMLRSHQLVYAAIAPLMEGDAPPVHAVDNLHTSTPPGADRA